jgi:hypothetical protein
VAREPVGFKEAEMTHRTGNMEKIISKIAMNRRKPVLKVRWAFLEERKR